MIISKFCYKFEFLYALTLLHAITTALGMVAFAALGLFQTRQLPAAETVPLALAFVGYVVFWNTSLKLKVSYGMLVCVSVTNQSVKVYS